MLDRALLLRFDASGSATGEDLVEFHCHGGVAVVRAVEQALLADPRARAAQPGEFTRQALTNGRIDLAQARGLADLLEAETETQRRHAITASDGHVSRSIQGWIDRLVTMAAAVEASIDYGDEGDVAAEAASLDRIDAECQSLAGEIEAVLAAPPVERWRDGVRIVLAGPPNAGKSTLLNLLAGRDAAIVSPTAGTTRDLIEVPVQRSGVAYVLSDTAGLRETADDPVEQVGIERAGSAIATADLVLWLGDERSTIPNALHVHARSDLPGRDEAPLCAAAAVSAFDAATIDALWEMIASHTAAGTSIVPLHITERESCSECLDAINGRGDDPILIADALRHAIDSLGRIIGVNATQATLDRLFRRFCVGK